MTLTIWIISLEFTKIIVKMPRFWKPISFVSSKHFHLKNILLLDLMFKLLIQIFAIKIWCQPELVDNLPFCPCIGVMAHQEKVCFEGCLIRP